MARERVNPGRVEYIPGRRYPAMTGTAYPLKQPARDLPTEAEMESMILAALRRRGTLSSAGVNRETGRGGQHVERALYRLQRSGRIAQRLGKWRLVEKQTPSTGCDG